MASDLIEELLREFEKDYNKFVETGDLAFLQEEYNQMLVNIKAEVRVLAPGNEYVAKAHGINQFGELMVEKADGSMENVFAGEVSVRGVLGYI